MKRRWVQILAGGSLGYIMLNRVGKRSVHFLAVRMARGAFGVSDQAVAARSKLFHGWQNIVEEARYEKSNNGLTQKNILSRSLDKMGNAMNDKAIDLMYRSAELMENVAFKLESRHEPYEPYEPYEDAEEEKFDKES